MFLKINRTYVLINIQNRGHEFMDYEEICIELIKRVKDKKVLESIYIILSKIIGKGEM